ncbi:hypothetical protein TTRE_0000643901 [Trichuris trichiura]|uniref:Uncharacterized protein n=1 Tax=Trichuris trichiura TaxID=36087 RepID=A0A077ZCN7_TRITR|nr:hypothetical protein TTRE_0000643901 [Trichuris trichiura]
MSEPTRTTRVRSRRRLVTRAGLHASRPNRRLSSRSAPDPSPRPDVVELPTDIAEAIGNRLVAQISSSIETQRLEMSSLATREPEAACRNEQGVRRGSLDTSGVKLVADMIPDGPAVVLS